jgi:hypothetical protein
MVFKSRDLEKEKYWQEIIAQYKQSSLSGSQFCKQHELTKHKFQYWKTVLEKRQKERTPQRKPAENKVDIPFVPLNLTGNTSISSLQNSSDQIEISKIVLRISAGADKSTLACILQSLEKSSC